MEDDDMADAAGIDKNTHVVMYSDDGRPEFYRLQGYIQFMNEALAIDKAKLLASEKTGRVAWVMKPAVRVGPAKGIEVTRL